tara:strand:- start:208 stop:387 length:180 start_codon:yes stop_codon:yes gene_type:complete
MPIIANDCTIRPSIQTGALFCLNVLTVYPIAVKQANKEISRNTKISKASMFFQKRWIEI